MRLFLLVQDGREYCGCDLMQALDMPQSTVSRHLALLKKNGWLRDRRGGVWMYYSLNRPLEPLLQAQLVLLINRLADSEPAREDRQRLEAYLLHKQRCDSTP